MFLIPRTQRGFTISELLMTLAMTATVAVMAVPLTGNFMDSARLNEAARTVERELAEARLRAVSSNRALRVRLNCPAAGSIRTVEFLNTAADSAADRCTTAAYPFPADDDLMTRPNYDGPVRLVPNGATVDTAAFEFRPDGRVLQVVLNVATTMATPQTVTITRGTHSRTVQINAAGKIQLQ
jgi:prepilin-type N-terminal cleavage/methylation domain-containing protein